MKELVAPRAKTYAYLMDDDSEKKKAEGTKKYVIQRRLTTTIVCLMIKPYYNHNKDLKVIVTKHILKKSIRLR